MDKNTPISNSRETFSEEMEKFEKDLKQYRDLMSKEKDILKTLKNNEQEFMTIVDKLIVSSSIINKKLNDEQYPEDIHKSTIVHYKIMFKHYDNYFDIQKKTAITMLKLENSKQDNKHAPIGVMRNKYINNEQLNTENKPKV